MDYGQEQLIPVTVTTNGEIDHARTVILIFSSDFAGTLNGGAISGATDKSLTCM